MLAGAAGAAAYAGGPAAHLLGVLRVPPMGANSHSVALDAKSPGLQGH